MLTRKIYISNPLEVKFEKIIMNAAKSYFQMKLTSKVEAQVLQLVIQTGQEAISNSYVQNTQVHNGETRSFIVEVTPQFYQNYAYELSRHQGPANFLFQNDQYVYALASVAKPPIEKAKLSQFEAVLCSETRAPCVFANLVFVYNDLTHSIMFDMDIRKEIIRNIEILTTQFLEHVEYLKCPVQVVIIPTDKIPQEHQSL